MTALHRPFRCKKKNNVPEEITNVTVFLISVYGTETYSGEILLRFQGNIFVCFLLLSDNVSLKKKIIDFPTMSQGYHLVN